MPTQLGDYQKGVRAAAAILLGLVALCALVSLSGCLTPAALAEMAQRAEVLSKEAKTQDCADAAANADHCGVFTTRCDSARCWCTQCAGWCPVPFEHKDDDK